MAVRQQTPIRTFHLRWPLPAAIEPERVAITYDRLSDTLFADFAGTARPAVSVQVPSRSGDLDVYARVDPVTEEVVGLQIEGVLDGWDTPPWLRDALAHADLRGIDRAEVEHLPNRAGSDRRAVVAALFDTFAPLPS